jgi:hypothetical protein
MLVGRSRYLYHASMTWMLAMVSEWEDFPRMGEKKRRRVGESFTTT